MKSSLLFSESSDEIIAAYAALPDLASDEAAFSGALPEGWLMTSLGAICDINPGKPRPDALPIDALVSFVPMSAVDAESGSITDQQTRPFSEVRKAYTAFQDGDVLFAKITPCMENGKAAIARNLTNSLGFGSTEFHVIRTSEAVLPEYIYYFVRQESFRQEAYENMSGTAGQARVPATYMAAHPLPLPPLAEQRRIVTQIEAALVNIDTANQRLMDAPAALRKFRESVLSVAYSGRLTAAWREANPDVESAKILLNYIFARRITEKVKDIKVETTIDVGDLPELPDSWEWATVGDLSKSIKYGYTESATIERVGPNFLRITDIQNDNVEWSTVPYCPITPAREAQYRLQSGDIVFARTGATTGKSYLVNNPPRAVFASYLIRVRPFPSIPSPYLALFFQSRSYWDQIEDKSVGIGQPNCNGSKLAAIVLPVPPVNEQAEIVRRVEALFVFADGIEKRVQTATLFTEKVAQAVLAKAFRAALVPTEAEIAKSEKRDYESADKLIERMESVQTETQGPNERRKRVRS